MPSGCYTSIQFIVPIQMFVSSFSRHILLQPCYLVCRICYHLCCKLSVFRYIQLATLLNLKQSSQFYLCVHLKAYIKQRQWKVKILKHSLSTKPKLCLLKTTVIFKGRKKPSVYKKLHTLINVWHLYHCCQDQFLQAMLFVCFNLEGRKLLNNVVL